MKPSPNKSARFAGVVIVLLLLGGAVALGFAIGRMNPPRAHETAEVATGSLYTCGMHPWVLQPEPGLCPICHMELTPIDPARFTGELAIDPVVAQNIGVRTAEVVRGELSRTIRTVGTVAHDQTAIHDVNLRFDGWVQKLHVDSPGQHVHAGDPLFDIYAPQLLATQQELLLAQDNPRLAQGARDRLRNLGLTDAQIDTVAAQGEASAVVTIPSPATGHVIEKNIYGGMRVEPATLLYRIADHTRVWVDVAVYEQQAPFVREGMAATLTVPQLPGQTFEGEVAFEYPHLDPTTRQLTLRLAFDNPELVLKPGMFAEVTLRGEPVADAVLVPREAVIDTGARRVAFVQLDEGRFEPRDVTLGVASGDGRVQVLDGLSPGERVVTSGQFLLDSEARLREAIAKMIAPPAQETPPAHDHAGPVLRDPLPGEDLPHYELETCLVSGLPLGAMGEPIVKVFGDMQIRFCCASCIGDFEKNPAKYLAQLKPEDAE